MRRIDQTFLTLAATCLVVGVCIGIAMGAAHDFQYVPVHAHVNLVGFVSMSVFGIVYKLYPELARSRLATAHLYVAAPSAVVLPVGIYLAIGYEAPGLAITASLVWLIGAVLFLANLVRCFVLAKVPAGREPGLQSATAAG
jgi:cbb3-type cytochrome oxidase subunit 1